MVYRDTRKQVVNLPFAADSLTPSNHISLGQIIRMAIFPVICLLIQIANRFLGMEKCSFLVAGGNRFRSCNLINDAAAALSIALSALHATNRRWIARCGTVVRQWKCGNIRLTSGFPIHNCCSWKSKSRLALKSLKYSAYICHFRPLKLHLNYVFTIGTSSNATVAPCGVATALKLHIFSINYISQQQAAKVGYENVST